MTGPVELRPPTRAAPQWLVVAVALTMAACGAAASTAQGEPPAADPAPPVASRRSAGARPVEPVREREGLRAPQLSRAALDRAIAAGPGWLLGQVPLEPVRNAQRQFVGFRIVSVFGDDPRALAYGVLPGDLLQRVQGQKILTPGDLMTVFQRLRGTAEVVVEVQRDRQLLTLRWPVVDPSPPATGR